MLAERLNIIPCTLYFKGLKASEGRLVQAALLHFKLLLELLVGGHPPTVPVTCSHSLSLTEGQLHALVRKNWNQYSLTCCPSTDVQNISLFHKGNKGTAKLLFNAEKAMNFIM